MHELQAKSKTVDRLFDLKTTLTFLLLSFAYFADLLMRASGKPFWFDELFTVYLCRLPALSSTLTAVRHGADFNPPLFYVLTRGAQTIFGQGAVAIRLPEIIGVWVFGASLFLFVARRLGRTAGLIAALFPFFTLARYYAYEARPHGITLGWCGLMLVCWQQIVDGRCRGAYAHLWNIGFAAAMLASVLTHVYAIYLLGPFFLVEGFTYYRNRKLHWGVVVGLMFSVAVALPLYIPMMRTYRQVFGVEKPDYLHVAGTTLSFVSQTVGDAIYLIFLFLLLIALAIYLRSKQAWQQPASSNGFLDLELLLAASFLALPFPGYINAILNSVPIFSRYFLSYLAGVAILLAYASSSLRVSYNLQKGFAYLLVLLMSADVCIVGMHAYRHKADHLVEPSSSLVLTTFSKSGEQVLLENLKPDIPVIDLDKLGALSLYYYAEPAMQTRIHFASKVRTDFFSESYILLADWAHLDLETVELRSFLAGHNHFYVVSSHGKEFGACTDCLRTFIEAGYSLRSSGFADQLELDEFSK